MKTPGKKTKQDVTVSLSGAPLLEGSAVAAGCAMSVSDLQIQALVDEQEAYERSERQARALLDQGFHLGGELRVSREKLYRR